MEQQRKETNTPIGDSDTTLPVLPKNVVASIFEFLNAKEICRLSMVSKLWYRASSSIDNRWKVLFNQDFGSEWEAKQTPVQRTNGYHEYQRFFFLLLSSFCQ